MKDILKSKGMILFLVMVLGFLYMNTTSVQKMENNQKEEKDTYITMNI